MTGPFIHCLILQLLGLLTFQESIRIKPPVMDEYEWKKAVWHRHHQVHGTQCLTLESGSHSWGWSLGTEWKPCCTFLWRTDSARKGYHLLNHFHQEKKDDHWKRSSTFSRKYCSKPVGLITIWSLPTSSWKATVIGSWWIRRKADIAILIRQVLEATLEK